jgi:hypothetical protein
LIVLLFVDVLSTSPPNGTTTELDAIVNARRLYNSCIQEDQIEAEGVNTILSLVNTEFGGWPILQGSQWDSTAFNFSQLLVMLKKYNIRAIYVTGTQIDDKNSSITAIRVRSNICELLSIMDFDTLDRSRWSWSRR